MASMRKSLLSTASPMRFALVRFEFMFDHIAGVEDNRSDSILTRAGGMEQGRETKTIWHTRLPIRADTTSHRQDVLYDFHGGSHTIMEEHGIPVKYHSHEVWSGTDGSGWGGGLREMADKTMMTKYIIRIRPSENRTTFMPKPSITSETACMCTCICSRTESLFLSQGRIFPAFQ